MVPAHERFLRLPISYITCKSLEWPAWQGGFPHLRTIITCLLMDSSDLPLLQHLLTLLVASMSAERLCSNYYFKHWLDSNLRYTGEGLFLSHQYTVALVSRQHSLNLSKVTCNIIPDWTRKDNFRILKTKSRATGTKICFRQKEI